MVRLDRARAKVVDLMADKCRIFRDPDGNDSDVLDPETLQLVPPEPAGTNYYSGPCRVTLMGTGRSTGIEAPYAETDAVVSTYKVSVPFDAPLVLRNDLVVILDSADFQLRGARMRVLEAQKATILVQRNLVCQLVS